MLLFEVGTWRSLNDHFTRLSKKDKTLTAKSFRDKIIEEMVYLEFRLGHLFKTAVLACLTGNFGVDGAQIGDLDLKLAYFETVVKRLDICRA